MSTEENNLDLPYLYKSIYGSKPASVSIENFNSPSHDVNVSRMHTYPCAGTGWHTECIGLYNETSAFNATWNGYKSDYHNITFPHLFTLLADRTYNYTIKTGSYPQIIHEHVVGGKITCTEFIDANGRRYDDWIPCTLLSSQMCAFSTCDISLNPLEGLKK